MNKLKNNKTILTVTIIIFMFTTLSSTAFSNNTKQDISKTANKEDLNITDEVGDFSQLYVYENNMFMAYSSYIDGQGYFPKVVKRTNKGWELIGNFDFEKRPVEAIDFFMDKGIMYVAYSVHNIDPKKGYILKVMKYNDNAWELVGDSWSTNEPAHSLYVSNSVPYIIENDHNELVVSKFSENKWQRVGNKNICPKVCNDFSLIIHNKIPYVAYSVDTTTNKEKVIVKQFDGTEWKEIGTNIYEGLLPLSKVSLFIDDNTPYIAFVKEESNSDKTVRKVVVMKYDGHNWIDVAFLDKDIQYGNIDLHVEKGMAYIAYEYDTNELYKPAIGIVRFIEKKAEIIVDNIKNKEELATYSNIELTIDNNNLYIAYQNKYPYKKHPEKKFDMHGEELVVKNIVVTSLIQPLSK
jgi:hypothetical protein